MIGPNAARSSGGGETVTGDATALTAGGLLAGGLLAGAMLDGNELGSSLTEAENGGAEAALEIATVGLVATEAAWCVPEHADSTKQVATSGADHPNTCRRASRSCAAGIPHSRRSGRGRVPTPEEALASRSSGAGTP